MYRGRKYPFSYILGWSVSRYEKFNLCKRQYYFDYYARRHDKEVSPEKLEFLKSLTSIPLEIGNVVHDTIALQLRRIQKGAKPQSASEMLNYASQLMDRMVREKNFMEIYYKQSASGGQIDSDYLKTQVESCLNSFLRGSWYQWLISNPAHRPQDWLIEPDDFGEVRIDGLKAYCKVDFLLPIPGGDLYILDWKTGKAGGEKHRRQMMGYVLYAKDMFQAAADQIRTVVVYLGNPPPAGQELVQSFSEDELQEFTQQIRAETEEMYQYCEDIERNIPKPKEFFPKRVGNICAYCNYQELCFPDQTGDSESDVQISYLPGM